MWLRRTWAMTRKELRHIARNRLTLFLVTISPALLLFMLSYVFSLNVEHADLAVMDLDRSDASRSFISTLTAGESLALVALIPDYQAAEQLLVAGQVDAVVVIPPGFTQRQQGTMLASRQPQVQVLVDGSNPIIAGQVAGMVADASNSAAVGTGAVRRIADSALASAEAVPLAIRSRSWYNPELKSLVSMVPGLLGVVLALPALALALSLTREKELGNLEGLMATPVAGSSYLLGKLLAFTATGTAGFMLSWLVAIAWFQVPFRGQLWLLILLTIAYFVACMGFSLFISTWISSQQTAMFLVMLVFFVPSFFLAGLIDPVDYSSPVSVLLSSPLPATHYIAISRGIFLKGLSLEQLLFTARLPSPLILLAMGLLGILFSTAIFKKKLG